MLIIIYNYYNVILTYFYPFYYKPFPLQIIQDYNHELICLTEREKYIIPIRCIGLRAVLDFPDEIYFTSAPVKVYTHNQYYTINLGYCSMYMYIYMYMYMYNLYMYTTTCMITF